MCADSVATVGSAFTARQEICEMGRRIYARAFVAANDGNISARLSADRILCTPTGVSKGFLTQDMLAICDMDGEQVSGPMKISSEIRMHLEAYKLREDIAAVVHAHPPTATGFAVALETKPFVQHGRLRDRRVVGRVESIDAVPVILILHSQ